MPAPVASCKGTWASAFRGVEGLALLRDPGERAQSAALELFHERVRKLVKGGKTKEQAELAALREVSRLEGGEWAQKRLDAMAEKER